MLIATQDVAWEATGYVTYTLHLQASFHGVTMHTIDVEPPSPVLFAFEPFHALCNYVAGHAWRLDPLPDGDGHPVLVFPGLGVSGAATADLRVRIKRLGYEVYDWKHGVNSGPGLDFSRWLVLLAEHLQEIVSRHGCSASLIGWSHGGIYARELAREHPQMVRQVITLATPFEIRARAADEENHSDWPGVTPLQEERMCYSQQVPPVPSVSLYSKTDGIVSWRGCLGVESGRHQNIEVEGVSHFGMVHHPEVLKVIAGLLSNPDAVNRDTH